MKANEARKLTEIALENNSKSDAQIVKSWLEHIYREIETACRKGESKITNPFDGVRMLVPTVEQSLRINEILTKEGFTINTYGERHIGGKSELIIKW